MASILIVDTNEQYQKVLQDYLTNHGFQVHTSVSGDDAYWLMKQLSFDLLITEIQIEVISGIQLIQLAKEIGLAAIVLTDDSRLDNEQQAFEAGCLDFVSKRVTVSLLLNRIRSVLDRPDEQGKYLLCSGDIVIDQDKRMVFENDQDVKLTYTEYEMLLLMFKNPFRAFSRQEMIERLWQGESDAYMRVIDTHVMSLRKKLKTHSIQSVRGFGYSWRMQVSKKSNNY